MFYRHVLYSIARILVYLIGLLKSECTSKAGTGATHQLCRVFQPRFYSRYMLIGEALAIVCRLHNNRRPFRPFLRIDGR